MEKTAKITFCGGTGSVTGANFLLEIDGKKILVDCGLTQGDKMTDEINWEPFPYDPKEIDILFVTHAHVDHLGRIPKLLYDGFRGEIYSTLPTKALASPMLEDTVGILSKNKNYTVQFARERFRKINSNYHQAEQGDCFLIFNNLGLLEIGIYKGRANELLGMELDSPVNITFDES